MADFFYEVLGEYIGRLNLTPGRLSQLSGIPKQTLVAWLAGRVRKPRSWHDLLRVATALRLYETETDRLLQSAGHGSIGDLILLAQEQQDGELLSLLSFWVEQREQQQKSVWAESPPFQAPPNITDFVGREEIVQSLKEFLPLGGRVCTLRGMGGVGKTALATCLAYECRPLFPDGVLWANLDSATENRKLNKTLISGILGAFAGAYGRDISEEVVLQSRSSIVREVLANKRALIILDNAQGTEEVEYLLPPSTAPCSVVITTRNKRMLRERALAIEVEPFIEAEGLALLSRVVGTRRVADEQLGAKRIVALLGGLPLAIRIVASDLVETKSLTLLEYYGLLQDERTRLEHLADWEDTSKDVRASFELSFKHLAKALQMLFAHLSIFNGAVFKGPDFSMDAVAAVVDMPLAILKKYMGQLKSLSLVETGSPGKRYLESHASPLPIEQSRQERYYLHPLLRIFATEKYEAFGGAFDSLAQRAANYFADLAYQNRRDGSHLLDLDWENIYGALRWARQNQQWEILTKGVVGLSFVNLGVVGYLDARGYWSEARELLSWLRENPALKDDPLLSSAVLFKQGAFALRQAEFETAENSLQRSLTHLDEFPGLEGSLLQRAYVYEFMSQLMLQRDPQTALKWSEKGIAALQSDRSEAARHEEGYLRIRQATVLGRTGKLQEALCAAQDGLTLLPPEPTSARVSGLMTIGTIHGILGHSKRAIAFWEEGIHYAQALGDNRRLAGLWQNIAVEAMKMSRFDQALENGKKALALYERIGDVAGESYVRSNLGEVYFLLGEDETALEHLTKVINKARQYQMHHVEVFALINHARLQLSQGALTRAASEIEKASDICQQLELAYLEAEIFRLQARLALSMGNIPDALTFINSSLEAATDAKEEGKGWRVKGDILCALADSEQAVQAYQKSLEILAEQNQFELARSQFSLGRFYLENRQAEKAGPLLEQAVANFDGLGNKRELASAKALLSQAP